jgi:hypothetical protein
VAAAGERELCGEEQVELTVFSSTHRDLLERWLAAPHVAPWYPDPAEHIAWALNPPLGGRAYTIPRARAREDSRAQSQGRVNATIAAMLTVSASEMAALYRECSHIRERQKLVRGAAPSFKLYYCWLVSFWFCATNVVVVGIGRAFGNFGNRSGMICTNAPIGI